MLKLLKRIFDVDRINAYRDVEAILWILSPEPETCMVCDCSEVNTYWNELPLCAFHEGHDDNNNLYPAY